MIKFTINNGKTTGYIDTDIAKDMHDIVNIAELVTKLVGRMENYSRHAIVSILGGIIEMVADVKDIDVLDLLTELNIVIAKHSLGKD